MTLNCPIAVKFEKQQRNQRKKERIEILFSSKNYQHKRFRCLINYTNKSMASYEPHREMLCVNFEACLFYMVIYGFPPHFCEKNWNVHISFYQCRHGKYQSQNDVQLNYLIKKMLAFTDNRLSVKARTEPNQTEPTEITELAQPNLRKLTDNYDYRYRVLAPLPIGALVLLTLSSLIIIIRYIVIIIIGFTDSSFSQLSNSTG